jgi:hypothetical protein
MAAMTNIIVLIFASVPLNYKLPKQQQLEDGFVHILV